MKQWICYYWLSFTLKADGSIYMLDDDFIYMYTKLKWACKSVYIYSKLSMFKLSSMKFDISFFFKIILYDFPLRISLSNIDDLKMYWSNQKNKQSILVSMVMQSIQYAPVHITLDTFILYTQWTSIHFHGQWKCPEK
jgi:hypothetical protein